MRFREWLKMDEARFKGLQRAYYKQNPGVPNYILHQMYQNHVSPSMKRSLGSTIQPVEDPLIRAKRERDRRKPSDDPMATAAYLPVNDPNATINYEGDPTDRDSLRNSPSAAMSKANKIDGIQWSPKPMVVNISPNDFGSETLARFRMARFGFERLDDRVRNDTQRTTTQQVLAASRAEGENEPTIMVRTGGKYELLEGYHRTMSHLIAMLDPKKGAPPDQVMLIRQGRLEELDFSRWQPDPSGDYSGAPVDQLMLLQSGDVDSLDFSKWKPVPIKAYIGRKGEELMPSSLPTSPLATVPFPKKPAPNRAA